MKYAALILTFFLVGAVAADQLVKYYYPNIGTIGSLTLYLNDVPYPDGTQINWGLTRTFSNMTVVNTGNVDLTAFITTENLPAGWILEWNRNNTLLMPNNKIEGWLNLTIPETETEWPSWGFYLIGETA